MRWTRAATLPWILALGACSIVSDLDPLRGADAGADADGGTDATVDVVIPQKGFTLSVTPAYVIADPGETHAITVTLTRAPGFTDPVNVGLNGPPVDAGISGQNAVVFADAATSAPITFKTDGKPTPTGADPYLIEVAGQSGLYTAKATFHLHIGALLASTTATPKYVTVTVPPYASSIDVKLWGGGGGGGGFDGACSPSSGGPGGGGGFLSARVPVAPSSALELVVGAGGTINPSTGAGGGGYSAVRLNGVPLVVAGGGGGGARNSCSAGGGSNSGQPGHALSDGSGSCTGKHGTATAGGAGSGGGGNGSALTGGIASPGNAKGGIPGGGNGGTAGGGGAGAFGGGAGGSCGYQPGGGGGGSGSVATGSTDVILAAGNGSTPGGTSDPDYGGVALGGTEGSYPSTSPNGGGNGRVVVRLTKTP